MKSTTQNYENASLNCGKYYLSKKNTTLIYETILLKSAKILLES